MALKKVSELKSAFQGVWEHALRAEGFGRINAIDKVQEPDVSLEIDNLIEYQRLVSFAKASEYDVDNRERFLVDYCLPVFEESTLRNSIIPKRSFVPKILNAVAMLYKNNPQRWLEEEKADETYQLIVKQSKLNDAMKRVYYWALDTNLVMVMPRIVPSPRGSRLEYIVRMPNSFRVLQDNITGEVVKLLYSAEFYGGAVSPENRVVVWTPEEVYTRDVKGQRIPLAGNEGMANPYGRIPAVFIQLETDESTIYAGGAWDLTEAALRRNMYELLLQDDMLMGAMGVWLAKNMSLSKGDVISPRKVYAYDDVQQVDGANIPPELENITGTPHAALISDMMDALFKNAAIEGGMSAAMLETQVREMSGRALRIMKEELFDRRQNDAERMEGFERELYGITAQVIEVGRESGEWSGDAIPTDAELFNVDFSENTESDLDELQRFQLEKEMVAEGLLSPVDWYMRYNTDITDTAEVEQRIAQNKAQLRKLTAAKGGLAELIAARAGAGGQNDAPDASPLVEDVQ